MFFSKLISAVIFTVVAVTSVWAQSREAGTLRGKIVDASSAAIAGASIRLFSRDNRIQVAGKSDQSGSYVFAQLAPGEYLVVVEAEGFVSTAGTGIRIDPTGIHNLDFSLDVAGVQSDIVVTAAGVPQTVTEQSRALTVVDQIEIDQRNETFVPEILRATPGVRVQQLAGPGSFTTVRFRGLRDADTSILIDGLRLRDASGFRGDFSGFLEDLMANNLDRVEVVRGSSAPLYGTAATGGVVNLVSRVGSGAPHGSVSFEGGTLGQLRERFTLAGGVRERFGYSFGVTRTDVLDGIDGTDVFRNTSFGTHLVYNFTPNLTLSGHLSASVSPRLDLNASPFPTGPAGNELGYETGTGPVTGFVFDLNDPDSRRTSSLLAGWTSLRHRVSDFWSYTVSYQGTRTRRNFSNGTGQDPFLTQLGVLDFPFETSRLDGENQVIESRHTLQFSRNHFLTVGVEHEREAFTQEFVSETFGIRNAPTTDRQNSTAFFFNDQLSFLNRNLQIGFGFRGQWFSVANPESVPELNGLSAPAAYTGDGSISYYFEKSQTKIRAHIGNSFRAPSLSERFSFFNSSQGRQRLGNPLIRPERALSVDGGLDQTLFGGRLRVSATCFYTRLQELITSTTLFQQVNVRGGLARGAEVEVAATPVRGLDLRFGYTYSDSQFSPNFATLRADNTTIPAGIARQQFGIPKHQVSFGANYAISRWNFNFDFSGISQYDEPLFSPNVFKQVVFTFDGYKKADVGVSYTLPLTDGTSLRFYTKVENVLNQRYFEDGFRTPRVVALGGCAFRF